MTVYHSKLLPLVCLLTNSLQRKCGAARSGGHLELCQVLGNDFCQSVFKTARGLCGANVGGADGLLHLLHIIHCLCLCTAPWLGVVIHRGLTLVSGLGWDVGYRLGKGAGRRLENRLREG